MSVRGAVKGVLEAVLPASAMMGVRRLHYFKKLMLARVEEENDLVIATKLVAPGDTVADVGANYGLYTRFLSQAAGPAGRVFSFEPIPTTYAVLSSSVSWMGLKNVRPVNCALSDHAGSVKMSVPRIGGGENFYQAHISDSSDGAADHTFEVKLETLDGILKDAASVAFVKIDVEGHELPCVRGTAAVLDKHSPALLIEVSGSPDHPGASAELFRYLSERGYLVYASQGLSLTPHTAGLKSVNYFFLKDRHVARLRANGVPVHGT